MRLNTSVVISALTFSGGLIWHKLYLWVPASVFVAGLVWLVLGGFASLKKRGSNAAASEGVKLVVNIIGLYATIGQLACIGLLIWWFVGS
jgi:hypothetical protein